MIDAISRQAAIRWIKTECNPCGNPTLDFESGKKVIEHLEQMPPVQQWIPCNERMPEDGIFVLVCNDDGKSLIAKWESEVAEWEFKYTMYDWDVWDDEEQGPAIAWMPLPKPYRR